jgi:hypothetical protein
MKCFQFFSSFARQVSSVADDQRGKWSNSFWKGDHSELVSHSLFEIVKLVQNCFFISFSRR